ncbi:MAG TPA: SDR family NAD(P)-dependent oxidoreductase [Actinomycetota bacterium]|nr:SDR family NAD(P)-dependent oxidoreductase [Actinomycetota bacterium]
MSDAQLSGRVAVVTGAAQGIGRCIAESLAEDGASVVVADIQEHGARQVAEDLRARGSDAMSVAVDIGDPASAGSMIERTLERFGRVDILVNDAGIDAPFGAPWEIGEEHWRRVIDVNLSGQWWCTRAVVPHMMERRAGRIIFISSGSARIGQRDISVAYNASKAGLIGLTVGLSVHLEPFGILVNAIAPGPTGTGQPMSEDERRAHEREYPLGIVGPEPIAEACRYLVRSSGDWISGAVLNVSGGWWRGF